MSMSAGDRLGSYEILGLLGAGGMGEVYRARDTRLKREVALKILPDSFAGDAERVVRFQREAETLASINHPHIAAIYGLENANGTRALVLELIQGETLADRIARGAIPIDEALSIASEIGEALEAAHEQGIIHRDLKPANIKVTPDGRVKVLDFGLAKVLEPPGSSAAPASSLSPTITSPVVTGFGVLLGTAAYMSPEQAKGRPADKRSDVWAFGCVLYEMLTGKRAFEGDDVSETLAAILRGAPDWSALRQETPPAVVHVLKQSLEKDRHRRLASVSAALFVLRTGELLQLTDARRNHATAFSGRWGNLIGLVAVIAIALLMIGGSMLFTASEEQPVVTRLTAATPIFPPAISGRRVAVSRDGSRVVYVDGADPPAQLWVRSLDRLDPALLAESGSQPFFSPDGGWVGYYDANDRMLKKVAVTGGAPIPLTRLDGALRGATWGQDDTIVFATSLRASGLQRVSALGGEVSVLTTPDIKAGEGDHVLPQFASNSATVLFTILGLDPSLSTGAKIAALDIASNMSKVKVVMSGGSDARHVSTGHLVYMASGTLRAVRFDLGRLEVRGAGMPVLQEVATNAGVGDFAIADDGTLVYATGSPRPPAKRTLTWVDRQGREEPLTAEPRAYMYPRISTDGSRVALDVRDDQNDIWIWHLGRRTLERLTTNPEMDRAPIWDGSRVIFGSNRGTNAALFSQPADRSSPAKPLTSPGEFARYPASITPDGTQLVVWEVPGSVESSDLYLMDLPRREAADGPSVAKTLRPLVVDEYGAINGEVSPDGKWLAYQSNETGKWEIHVKRFPDGGLSVVSTGGGIQPVWSRKGDELFFLSPSHLMRVRVGQGSEWVAPPADRLFAIDTYYLGAEGTPLRTYDVAPDGMRFLMVKPNAGETQPDPRSAIVVVQNWFSELQRLVPTN